MRTQKCDQFRQSLLCTLYVIFGAGFYMPLSLACYYIQAHHSWQLGIKKKHNTMRYIWVIQAKSNAVFIGKKNVCIGQGKITSWQLFLAHPWNKSLTCMPRVLKECSGEIFKINPLVCLLSPNCNHPKLLRPRVDILSVLPLCLVHIHVHAWIKVTVCSQDLKISIQNV